MNKEKLIDKIVSGANADSGESDRYRQWLLTLPVIELDRILDEQNLRVIREEAQRQVENDPAVIAQRKQSAQAEAENVWRQFFLRHSEIADHAGNRQMIFDRALSLSDDGVVRLQHLDEAATLLGRRKVPVANLGQIKQPLTTANEKHDEETLRRYCRGRFEFNTAALGVLRKEFGADFDSVEIDQALQSGLIQLDSASEEKLAEWAQEDAEQRQNWLANEASPEELREAARQEAEQRRLAAQQQFVNEQDEAGRKREAALGKPRLPEADPVTGEKWGAIFFNKLSVVNREKFRWFVNRFGGNQIVDRMRSATQVV